MNRIIYLSLLAKLVLLLTTTTSVALAMACSLCPPESPMLNAGRMVPFTGGKTCADIEGEISKVPNENCPAAQAELTGTFHVPSFCGCEGVELPTVCSFCQGGGDDVIKATLQLPRSNGLTCSDAQTLARFVTDNTVCTETFTRFEKGCCGAEDRCSVCQSGAQMKYPNRPFWGGSGSKSTCLELNQAMGFANQGRDCKELRMSVAVDTEYYCGCSEDAMPPPDQCNFCEDRVLANGNMVIPGTNGIKCNDMEKLARYVLSDDTCSEIEAIASSTCCAAGSTGSGMETGESPDETDDILSDDAVWMAKLNPFLVFAGCVLLFLHYFQDST